MYATRPIQPGECIVQLTGKLRTHAEADALYDKKQNGHTFLFELNEKYVIDASVNGNLARWINHSCHPNCEAVIEEDQGGRRHRDKIFIEAIRAIDAGEELTYDYSLELDAPPTASDRKQWPCRCGAENCIGTMLRMPSAA